MTRSTSSSDTAASILTLGRKSTTYSAPRYSSVWPFWRPKPLTSVTVMPCTPMADKASRTSSSLKGLTMAVTIFMVGSPVRLAKNQTKFGLHDLCQAHECYSAQDFERMGLQRELPQYGCATM